MREWVAAGIIFFGYVAAVAPLLRGLDSGRRRSALGGAGAGLLLCAAAHLLPPHRVLHEWLLPPALLLLAYWSSGALFTGPMPRIERGLEATDRRLKVDRAAAAAPRWLAELLELAYAGVYAQIPIALAIHLFMSRAPDADRFWTVILVTDFVCFAFLPWIRTRPPRAARRGTPWTSRIRSLNLRLLGTASIQVNTFPSGHAAEALAATLLLADAPWPLLAWMSINAVLISGGAVFGRYHYAADAFAGWMVAFSVWMVI